MCNFLSVTRVLCSTPGAGSGTESFDAPGSLCHRSRRGSCLASPLPDFLLSGALHIPGPRDREVYWAAQSPLVRPSLVLRLERASSSAVPKAGASRLT